MRRLGLGEFGEVRYTVRYGRQVAMVNYRDFSGVRRRLQASGRTKAEARRAVLRTVESTIASGSDADFSPTSTVEAGARAWLEDFEALVVRGVRSPSTLDLYRDAVERHLIPGIGALRIGELTTARVDRFLRSILRSKGYATAKLTRTVLSGVCGYLSRQGALQFNPVRDAGRLEADHDRTPRALTPVEVRHWLALLDESEDARRNDLPTLARFILATGLRIGEALGVRWSDIDFDHGLLSVQRTLLRLRGKGIVESAPKSKSSIRVLVLPGWCLTMLQNRRRRIGSLDGPVFPDAKGGYRDKNNVGAAFRRVRTGTPFEWVKPHTYRKTVATILDNQGASARMIADQLGHARVSMTQDVYMGRRAVHHSIAAALESANPDARDPRVPGGDDETDPGTSHV